MTDLIMNIIKKKIGKDKIDNQVYKESDSTLVQILISHDENSVYMIEPMSFCYVYKKLL